MKINGEKLKYYRIEKAFTQEELSLGICSITYLSKLENNKIDGNEDILLLLCKKLDIPIDDLTYQIPPDFFNLFHALYNDIKHQNDQKAFQTYAEIEKYAIKDDPTILTYYYLISLRYALFLDQFEEAKQLREQLVGFKMYLNEEQNYYYALFLGLYDYHYSSFSDALPKFKMAETVSNRLHIYEAELPFYMALTYSHIKREALSLIYCKKAMDQYNQELNFSRVIDCHLLMGITYNHIKAFDLAEASFHSIISSQVFTRLDKIHGKIYHNLGVTHSEQSESQKAIDYFKKALKIKNNHNHLNSIFLLAKEYLEIGDLNQTKEWLNYGLNISNSHNNKEYIIKFTILDFQFNKIWDSSYETYLSDIAIPYFLDKGSDDAIPYIEALATYYLQNYHYKLASKYLSMANTLLKEGTL